MALELLCLTPELKFRKKLMKTVKGVTLAAFWLESGEVRVVGGVCPHAGGMIAAGEVHDGWVRCPSHNLQFSLETGQCRTTARYRLPVFSAHVDNRRIYVDLDRLSETPDGSEVKEGAEKGSCPGQSR